MFACSRRLLWSSVGKETESMHACVHVCMYAGMLLRLLIGIEKVASAITMIPHI